MSTTYRRPMWAGQADAQALDAALGSNGFAAQEDRQRAGALGLSTVRVQVSPHATLHELAFDFECLFGTACSALEAMTDTAVHEDAPPELSESWFAMLYTMRAAKTVARHLFDKLPEGKGAAGDAAEAAP